MRWGKWSTMLSPANASSHVDALQDYFDIVKRPMDLSTIRCKLEEGQYAGPWDFIDDMTLMFDNAWLYNRKTSKVFKYCTKVKHPSLPTSPSVPTQCCSTTG